MSGTRAAPRAVVVGAGVGGLAAAARLAHQGFQVDVYESTKGPGGRCGQLSVDGYRWDIGPTILLMPEVIEETFTALGRRMADYLTLERCYPNYRVSFRDGSQLTLTGDRAELERNVEAMEPGSYPRLQRFLAHGGEMYRESLQRFVGRNFDHLGQFLTPANLKSMLRIRALGKLYPLVARTFQDDRLRAALTFQTMYLGISPYEAPGVYGLLPYAELEVGIYLAQGGLYALPRALEKLAQEEGVRFHYGERVQRIDLVQKQARGVTLKSGEQVSADLVLCNADLPAAYEQLLDPAVAPLPRKDSLRYTSSGFMLYWGLDRVEPGLLRHNVFFGAQYREAFQDIFQHHRVPEDLSFYVNVPSRGDASMAPAGTDALYVLVPVPSNPSQVDWKVEAPRIRERVLSRLAQEGYPELARHIRVERQFTPDDWEQTFSLARGAAFGLAHNFFQIGPFRPANQDRNVKNLFFVGASTQPGTGLPTVMLSARLAVERMVKLARERGFGLRDPRGAEADAGAVTLPGQEVPA